MRKLAVVATLAFAACSPDPGAELIAAPDPTTTALPINTTALPPAPTTTEPPTTTTTTEPEPTTTVPAIPRRASTTTTGYLREEATSEWAIPTYIVMCESGGNWNAYNPSSGASGPYQLMPLHFGGELAMHQSREAQHAKAAQLWNGGKGKSHWSACL